MDFTKLRHGIFFGFLAIITVVFLYMIRYFAYPIFWAAVIAGIFYPVYKYIAKGVKNNSVASIVTLLLVFFIIFIPILSISTLLAREATGIYSSALSNKEQITALINNVSNFIQNNPVTDFLHIDRQFWIDKLTEATTFVTSNLISRIPTMTKNTFVFLGMVIIMFYTLFFFLRDGKKMLIRLMHLCPLGDKYEKMLYEKFTSTARATLKGTVIVGGLQGALGGLLFYVAGIEGAFIWGVIMAALSIIPPFSSMLVWLPAGIIMLATGHLWQGLLILLFGALVISTIDNLLKPALVGKDAQIHPLLVLFSTLGGLILFDVSGFIIGPIIASLFIAFWEMYDQYYKDELSNNKEL